jgi:GGDEF domain-containing protein
MPSLPLNSDHQITQVVVTFTDITDHKLAEEALRYRALHDALTGLPNRALLLERLNHALHQAQRYADHLFAVLFIDLGELQKRIYQLSWTDENVVLRQQRISFQAVFNASHLLFGQRNPFSYVEVFKRIVGG